jgi:hypothetical protein
VTSVQLRSKDLDFFLVSRLRLALDGAKAISLQLKDASELPSFRIDYHSSIFSIVF